MFRCSTISILTFSFVSAITHVTAHGQLTIGANIQSNSLTPALASEPTLPQSNQTNLTNLTNFQGVLVVVNDTPITDTDLAFRLNLDLATANTPNTNENRALFAQRSLDNLILDTIKITEAEQNDIVVSDTDIQRGLVDIASQNGQNITEFLADLQRQGIPPSTLVRLIRAQFAWRAITAAALSNEPAILAEDIDAEISRLNSLRGRRERLLTEIFLPYSLYGNQAETQRAARELVGEIKAGTRFADLARQHSYASSAANGGRVGWVAEGTLDPVIERGLAGLFAGHKTDTPIETRSGVHIFGVLQTRAITATDSKTMVRVLQLFRRLQSNLQSEDSQRAINILNAATLETRSCPEFNSYINAYGDGGGGDMGMIDLAMIPPAISSVLAVLPDNVPSAILPVQNGASVFMVCDRSHEISPATREQIEARLTATRRIRYLARHEQDLVRQSVIEYRF